MTRSHEVPEFGPLIPEERMKKGAAFRHFLLTKSKALNSYFLYQGAGKRPRQCCHPKGGNGAEGPKGPRTKGTATRGPEGPESRQNMRVRVPEGPEDEQS